MTDHKKHYAEFPSENETKMKNLKQQADYANEEMGEDEDYTVSETIVFPGRHERKKEEENSSAPFRKKKRKHKKIAVRKMLRLSRFTVAFLILADVLLVYDVVLMTRYASLSQSVFYKVNIAVMIIIAAVNIFTICALLYKKKVWLTVILVISQILDCGGAYGAYALIRVNSSINDMTATSYTKSVDAALVIYSGNDKVISSVKDLDGKTVGIAEGTDTAEVGKQYLDKKNLSVEYKSYTGYTDLFKALINNEIDSAVLPVSYSSLIDSDQNLYSFYEDTSILASFSSDVQASNEAGADKDLTTEPFTVLISGENEGLADTIILASVNPISMTVTMVSIPRDSYVPITCYNNSSSKINAAHSVSESCLVDTVEQLTGVSIDYTAEFTFASVIEIVDAVGGVDVVNDTNFYGQSWDVENDELKVVPIPYDESGAPVHMNGEQALGFVRERHAFTDGDFARERHQQEVIQQVIAKVMATRNPNTYLDLLQAAGNNLKTNLSSSQVLAFVNYAMSKANRYYNNANPIGVFNFRTSRLTGADSSIYDSSLGLELYIYRLYDGAVKDAYTATENNVNLNAAPDKFTGISWSASRPYTAPAMIQNTYDEVVESGSDTSSYSDSSSDNSYYYEDTLPQNNTENQYYDNSTQSDTSGSEATGQQDSAGDSTTDSNNNDTEQVQDNTQAQEKTESDFSGTEG